MLPDPADTIAAIATAPGPAPRGVLRVSGDRALPIVAACVDAPAADRLLRLPRAGVVPEARLRLHLAGRGAWVTADLLAWPGARSYTRQPTVELHTVGSDVVLNAALRALLESGARLAAPGEFTLRALRGGRLDLAQAEGVLGVIHARDQRELGVALSQMAGGLSKPLAALRSELVSLLAELEAGLDFSDEEGVRFIEAGELAERLEAVARRVQGLVDQRARRGRSGGAPRVALLGPVNAGKSSLFNALVERYGVGDSPRAIAHPAPRATRDYLAARIDCGGMAVELLDTAGLFDAPTGDTSPDARAARASLRLAGEVDLVVRCVPPDAAAGAGDDAGRGEDGPVGATGTLTVATKCDLAGSGPAGASIATSSATGRGLEELRGAIADALGGGPAGGVVPPTAARCGAALEAAAAALRDAATLALTGSEELVAADLRAALAGLGDVAGDLAGDELLDLVFSRFCIGK